MAEGPVGVLVMAYGTPAGPDDIEAYYTHVRRGRPPTPELLAELAARYEAIGGTSPLLARTRDQVSGIARALGPAWDVELGQKHAYPFIEDGAAALVARGVERIVGVVLAPHYSSLSVGQYEARLRRAVEQAGPGRAVAMVASWHLEPSLVGLLARDLAATLERFAVADCEVVFTAHSLPTRVLDSGDPYPRQLAETAEAVAAAAGVDRWSIGWQSAGRTAEPWIGPDILELIDERAAAGSPGMVVCPAGFTSDHLEILYDLDVEAARRAASRGLDFTRTQMPNDHPALCHAVAEAVRRAGAG